MFPLRSEALVGTSADEARTDQWATVLKWEGRMEKRMAGQFDRHRSLWVYERRDEIPLHFELAHSSLPAQIRQSRPDYGFDLSYLQFFRTISCWNMQSMPQVLAVSPGSLTLRQYRGTSLIRTCFLLGPYSRHMPRGLWWSRGGCSFDATALALTRECGTHKTVKARFWPWLAGKSIFAWGVDAAAVQGYLAHKNLLQG